MSVTFLTNEDKQELEQKIEEAKQNGGSVDVDLSNYVTKDEMPEIDVDEVVSEISGSENIYPAFSADKWVDNCIYGGIVINNENYCYSPKITVKPNTRYAISHCLHSVVSYTGVTLDKMINITDDSTLYTFDTPQDCYKITLTIDKREFGGTTDINTAIENFNSVFMLVEGETLPTEFVPYVKGGYKLKENVSLPDNSGSADFDNYFTTQAENEEPTYSEELASANGWTSDGWSGDFANGFTNTSGNTNPLIFTMPEETAQNTYRIAFRCSEDIAPNALMVKCGGSELFDLYGQNAEPLTVGIVSVENGNVEFVPAGTFTGTITDISIKRVTGIISTGHTITDSTGKTSFEIRTTKAKQNNIFLGNNAGENNVSGYGCVAVGKGALNANTSGFWNIGVGFNALRSNTVGSRNVVVGYTALGNNITGSRNIALGSFALNKNTIGNKNIAIGADSIDHNISGSENVGIGYSTLYNNTTGSNNLAIGSQAIAANTTGIYNTAVGAEAMNGNTTGNYNVAIGAKALSKNGNASNNVAIGYTALYGCKAGKGNAAIGLGAGKGANGTFNYGVFLGFNTGAKSTNGADYNVFIGYNAGDNVTTGANNICIGKNARTPTETTSNYLNIGDLIVGSMNTDDKYAKINGGLQLSDIPTADPVIAGRIWNDNGTLKVSAG